MQSQPHDDPLFSSEVVRGSVGVGTWAWGDRLLWGYGRGYSQPEVRGAFQASVEAGLRLFDTAEIYGLGRSERFLGQFAGGEDRPIIIATKFFPYPWRWRKENLLEALRGSLRRLEMDRVDLYQMHFPFPPVPIETWMEGLADAVDAGLTGSVGVSNYGVREMRRAHAALARRGVPLASNQVAYHLLDRGPERSGLLDACNELGVTLIAHTPLARGLLTGKYTPLHRPPGLRRLRFSKTYLYTIQPLLRLLREIGDAHDGRSPAQVAVNWLICKGTLPIPGAKSAQQARENAGAAGWRLAPEAVDALDAASSALE
jgi:aryl-alcohol dehydrogenase-like predicted oxidoreductase